MTITAERVANFVFSNYVRPARERGDDTILIPVRQVWKALDCAFPLGLIQGVVGSMRFRNTYQLALIAEEGDKFRDTYVFKIHRPDLEGLPHNQPSISTRRVSPA